MGVYAHIDGRASDNSPKKRRVTVRQLSERLAAFGKRPSKSSGASKKGGVKPKCASGEPIAPPGTHVHAQPNLNALNAALNASGGGPAAAAPGLGVPFDLNALRYEDKLPRLHAANRERPSPPIAREKLALVHIARKQTGLDEAGYRELLWIADGVDSSKHLSEAGFDRVMRGFAKIGFVHRPTGPVFGDRCGMATNAQIDVIRGLWARWRGGADEASLNRWLERRFHVTSLRFASVTLAQMAIEGLKAMLARKATKSAGRSEAENS